MTPILYTVVGTRGRWFIEHAGGRYGPIPTKKEAVKLAAAATAEARTRGIEATVREEAPR